MTTINRILSTFDIKPSAPIALVGSRPDELMIDCTTLPTGTRASFYLPSVSADGIVATAASLYGYHAFTRIDAHTVGCEALGIAYLPIPRASGNLAGFIDVELPNTVRKGDKFTVAVSQLTTARAQIARGGDPVLFDAGAALVVGRGRITQITWRKVIGNFQLAFKVDSKTETLHIVERNLSLLRWIFAAIPPANRWYPVFARYLGALSAQVTALDGNPNNILPSGYGTLPGDHGGPGHGSKPVPNHGPKRPRHDAPHVVGKIEGLVYDHFGDFEGFILETEGGHRIHFFSREARLEAVVARAWDERLRVTVAPEDENECHPRRIILHPTPGSMMVRT